MARAPLSISNLGSVISVSSIFSRSFPDSKGRTRGCGGWETLIIAQLSKKRVACRFAKSFNCACRKYTVIYVPAYVNRGDCAAE